MDLTKQKVEPILKKSVKALLEQQDRHGCWSFPAHLGSHYISLYALFLEWLRFRGFSSRLDLNRLARILLETQLPDGSWRQARDPATAFRRHQCDRAQLCRAQVLQGLHLDRQRATGDGCRQKIHPRGRRHRFHQPVHQNFPGAFRIAWLGGDQRNPLPDFPGGAATQLPAILAMGHPPPASPWPTCATIECRARSVGPSGRSLT
jgi:hypothetical protein